MARRKREATTTRGKRFARLAAFLSSVHKEKTGTKRPEEPQSAPSAGPSTLRPRVISQLSLASQYGEQWKKTRGARTTPAVILRGIGSKLRTRLNQAGNRFISAYRQKVVTRPAIQPINQTQPGVNPFLGSIPATFTGLGELPLGKAFFIFILWFPRFFIPWITDWHEFNVYLLSSPWDRKIRQAELFQNKIYLFFGKFIATILCSMTVDLIRRKWELKKSYLYLYQPLLILFTFCPLAGGFVDATLRTGFHDDKLYRDWWLSSILLMQWAMSVAFIMFPVQLSSIYIQHKNMSRNAHYNWTSVFVLLEFINAYVAFFVIPGPCPTFEWAQIAGWAGLLLMMTTLTMLTLIIMFNILAFDVFHEISYYIKAVLAVLRSMLCSAEKTETAAEKTKLRYFVDVPLTVQMEKLVWFSIAILPVIWSKFSISVVKSFLPDEDWNNHTFMSALSVFLFWRIMGVLLMVLVMFGARNQLIFTRRNTFNRKPEMIYLGLPICLCVLALTTVFGRLTTLSQPTEGDVILGPIHDQDKVVMIFVNTMFKNWTICVSSTYFPPVKIRPQQLVARELYDLSEENLNITIQVDPCFEPAITRIVQVENIKKGEWKIFRIQLRDTNRYTGIELWDYHRTLECHELRDVGSIRPQVGTSQILIFQWEVLKWSWMSYYEMNHSSYSIKVPVGTIFSDFSRFAKGKSYVAYRNKILWNVPAVGTWTVRLWCKWFLQSDYYYAGATNCSPCQSPLKFDVENNSLYLLIEYPYEEKTKEGKKYGPPYAVPFYWFRTPTSPGSFVIFKLGEVAGPGSDHLPNREELQKDWAIRVSLALAGMAAGGIFLGFVYLFWVDPPIPRYRTVCFAVCWVLMAFAEEVPRIRTINVGLKSSIALLSLQIIMTGLHFVGAYFMSDPRFNFRL